MKKWSFLVATLLLMGATATTFTSCVDTDEPEGILEMRKAKAEYIRALAAVENAKIAYQQAAAQNEAANAELAKAQAETAKAQAEIAKAQAQATIIAAEAQAKVDQLLAEGKNEIAKAEAAKLLAEAAQAKAECDQTIAVNEIKLQEFKANLEVKLQQAQTELVNAQMQYKLALKDLAALDLIASPVEAAVLAQARTNYENAYADLTKYAKKVADKQQALIQQMYSQEDALDVLNHKILDKQVELAAKQAAYEELKKLAANVTITAWEARRDSLAQYVGNGYGSGKGTWSVEEEELNLQKKEIEQSAEYKAAYKTDTTELKAYVQAQQYYNFLSNDPNTATIDCSNEYKTAFGAAPKSWGDKTTAGTHTEAGFKEKTAAKSDYKVSEIKEIKIENAQLKTKFEEAIDADDEIKATTTKTIAQVKADLKTRKVAEQENLTYDLISGDNTAKLDASKALAAWKKAAEAVKVTAEEAAADTCNNKDAKNLADAKTKHAEALEKWQKMHKIYEAQDVEKSVSTDAFKASIKKYNDNIDALEAAVKAYNTAYDKAVADNKTAIINGIKASVGLEKAKEFLSHATKGDAVLNTIFTPAEMTGKNTKAQLDALVASKESSFASKPEAYNTLAKVQAKVNAVYDNAYGNEYSVNAVAKIEKWAAENAVLGVSAGAKPIADVGIVTVANDVAAATQAQAVKDADAALKPAAAGKPETVIDKLNKEVADSETDAAKKDNGSYKAISVAVATFKTAAGDNCEKLKKAEDSNAAAIKKATGAGTKFFAYGQSKDATEGTVIAGDGTNEEKWITAETKKGESIYEATGHKVVTRTKISDDVIGKMTAVEFDSDQATTNFENASNAAFGMVRHNELKASEVVNGKAETYNLTTGDKSMAAVGGTLKKVMDMQAKVDNHTALAAVAADAQKLVAAIAAAQTALDNELAELAKPVNAAQAAIAPAKAAHQASHNAASKLTADVDAKIAAISNKVTELNNIQTALNNILKAYYNNQTIKYATFEGDTDDTDKDGYVEINWGTSNKEFKTVEKWLNTQIKKYTTKAGTAACDPEATTPVYDHGYIANAQRELDELQERLDRYTENGVDQAGTAAINDFLVEKAQLDLDKAQALLKLYQEKFNRADEALSKVLEAIGNGVANGSSAVYTPTVTPGSTGSSNSGEYYGGVGANTNTSINVDL